jgi:protein gp37
MNKNTSINWPGLTHTLNPVVGCLRGCCKATRGFDCYADKLHTMRHRALLAGKKLPEQYRKPFTEIQYLRARIFDRDLDKPGPFKIFVGDMTDHAYWPKYVKEEIICSIEDYPQHTFMMLTKDPKAYSDYDWTENVMCGTTITFYSHEYLDQLLLNASRAPRPFLSIEPILGNVPEFDYSPFEVVIVGKDNTRGAQPPKPEWIASVKANIPPNKIWWKQAEIQPTYKP